MNKLLICILSFFYYSSAFTQNVGIGTASPKHKLVVEGDRINLQNKENTKLFHIRTDGDEIDITTIGSHFWITAENDKHIILNPNTSSSGNIGIGTYNPTEKLHVNGALRAHSLEGTGNRILYASPTGIIATSSIDVSELERSNKALKKKIADQEILIQELLKRVEALEQ